MNRCAVFQFKGRKRGRGFALLEFMILLAVLGIVIAAVFGRGERASSQADSQREVENVQTIAASLQRLFGTTGNFNGLDNQAAINGGAVPRQMVSGSSTINHGWAANGVQISATSGGAEFEIQYTDVPGDACSAMASTLLPMFRQTTVNGSVISGAVDATNACTQSSNTITWVRR